MTRSHADPVEVLRRDGQPTQFLWRGRLHLVRVVLGHWFEVLPWWRGAEAAALRSGAPPGSVSEPSSGTSGAALLVSRPVPGSPRWGQRMWGEPAADLGRLVPSGGLGLPTDREVWRVEATAGRSTPAGVYDLSLLPDDDRWLLIAVHD